MEELTQKICNEIADQYKPDKNVLGILLFGSAARNKFDKYSDIDIYVLLDKKGKFSRSNFIENKSSMYNVIHYYHKDKTFMFPGKEVLKLTISDIMLLRHLITIKSKLLPETITIPWDEQDGDEGFI